MCFCIFFLIFTFCSFVHPGDITSNDMSLGAKQAWESLKAACTILENGCEIEDSPYILSDCVAGDNKKWFYHPELKVVFIRSERKQSVFFLINGYEREFDACFNAELSASCLYEILDNESGWKRTIEVSSKSASGGLRSFFSGPKSIFEVFFAGKGVAPRRYRKVFNDNDYLKCKSDELEAHGLTAQHLFDAAYGMFISIMVHEYVTSSFYLFSEVFNSNASCSRKQMEKVKDLLCEAFVPPLWQPLVRQDLGQFYQISLSSKPELAAELLCDGSEPPGGAPLAEVVTFTGADTDADSGGAVGEAPVAASGSSRD